ncbi:hypothetical protein ANO11243_086870 [Dothideomycetidae sp. 11243]|nr:hypothetical protein ANO11243_086870 [fungal sp. No.11243]
MAQPNLRRLSDEEAYMLDDDEDQHHDDHVFHFEHRSRNGEHAGAFDIRQLLRTIATPFRSTSRNKSSGNNEVKVVYKRRRCLDHPLVKLILYLPITVLASFGVLHILRSTLSGDGLFYSDSDEPFLPDWGKPGHDGEFIAHYPTDATRDVIPIPCHSHNDYWRRIPLFEALHYGCTGVEADVWLKHDELYVGHNTASLTQNRTFSVMYVEPLVQLLEKQNPRTEFVNASGHGVFDEVPEQTLVLLVDFKTDGLTLWPKVVEQLEPLRERGYLSYWDGSETRYRAITVVATGFAPFDMVIANTTYRDVLFDAPLHDLTGVYDKSNSYYASTSLHAVLGSVKYGRLSDEQLQTMRSHIAAAKQRGLKSRYWDTPAWPAMLRNRVWRTLVDEGADVLNVDDLRSAAKLDWRRHEHGIVW